MSNVSQEVVFDVDTFTVVERIVRDGISGKKKIWKDGKIKTYPLHKSGGHGKLQDTVDWL